MFHTWIFIYCEEGRTVCIYTEDSEGSYGECKSFIGSLVTTQRDMQRTGSVCLSQCELLVWVELLLRSLLRPVFADVVAEAGP